MTLNPSERLALSFLVASVFSGCVLQDYNEGAIGTAGGAIGVGGSSASGGTSSFTRSSGGGGQFAGNNAGGRGGAVTSTSGGSAPIAGSVATGGGASGGENTGGASSTPGGASGGATGGAQTTLATGGVAAAGGVSFVTGGKPPTGGTSSTGGMSLTGGASSTGGMSLTGGASFTGGASSTSSGTSFSGGTSSTGGASPSGGNLASGGAATGGQQATGGSTATGGTVATGGACSTGGAGNPAFQVCAVGHPCAVGLYNDIPSLIGADATQFWFLWPLSAGTILAYQVALRAGYVVKQLGLYTSIPNGAAGGTFQLALYQDDGSTLRPGKLVATTGTLLAQGGDNTCSNNVPVYGSINYTVPADTSPALYWVAVWALEPIYTLGENSGVPQATHCYQASTAWPDPAGAGNASCVPSNRGNYLGAAPAIFAIMQ